MDDELEKIRERVRTAYMPDVPPSVSAMLMQNDADLRYLLVLVSQLQRDLLTLRGLLAAILSYDLNEMHDKECVGRFWSCASWRGRSWRQARQNLFSPEKYQVKLRGACLLMACNSKAVGGRATSRSKNGSRRFSMDSRQTLFV